MFKQYAVALKRNGETKPSISLFDENGETEARNVLNHAAGDDSGTYMGGILVGLDDSLRVKVLGAFADVPGENASEANERFLGAIQKTEAVGNLFGGLLQAARASRR